MEDKDFDDTKGQMGALIAALDYQFDKMSKQLNGSRKSSPDYRILKGAYIAARSIARSTEELYSGSGHELAIIANTRILIEYAATAHYLTAKTQNPNTKAQFLSTGLILSGGTDKRGRPIRVPYSQMIEQLPVEKGATWPREFYSRYSSAVHFDSNTASLASDIATEKHAYVMALRTVHLFVRIFELLIEMGYTKK